MVGQPLRLPSFDPASDALALQIFNRRANIGQSHIRCYLRTPDSRRHNESHLTAFEFLIELQCVEDLSTPKFFWQSRWQPELPEEIENRIALMQRQPNPFDRDGARSNNSKAQRFSVKKSPIISGALDRVPNRVTEIKKSAFASLVALVFRDDIRFDFYIALDQLL